MTAIDRLRGLSQTVSIKAPCRVATTGNITLNGLQTIDGVALASGDRVLVWAQTNPVLNGIYAADTSDWQRDVDFSGIGDSVEGTLVGVNEGTSYPVSFWRLTTDAPVIGTSSLTFVLLSTSAVSQSTTSFVGTIAALRALSGFPTVVDVLGYWTAIDHKPRKYVWYAGDATADNGGTVIRPTAGGGCYKMGTDEIHIRDFGAKGDGVTNDSASLIAAGIAAEGKTLIGNAGNYLCDNFRILGGTTVRMDCAAVFKPWSTTIISTTITTTASSTAATVGSPTGLANGMYIGASCFYYLVTMSGLSGSNITLSAPALTTGTVNATFGLAAAAAVVVFNGDGINWYGGKIAGAIYTSIGTLTAPFYTLSILDTINSTGRPLGIVIEDLELVGGIHGINCSGIENLTLRNIISTDHYNQGLAFSPTTGNGGPHACKIEVHGYRAERCGMGEGIKFGGLFDTVGATTTISTTSGSEVASVASATGIKVNQLIVSANVPTGTYVESIVGVTITMSANATGTAIGTAAVFAWRPYTDIQMSGLTILDCGKLNADPTYWQEGIDLFLNAADVVHIHDFNIKRCGNGGIEIKRFTPTVYITPDRMYDIKISDGFISCDYDTCVGIALNRSGADDANDTAKRISISNVQFLHNAGADGYGISSSAYSDVDVSGCQFYGAFAYDILVSPAADVTPDETARRWTIGGCTARGAATFFSSGNGYIEDFTFLPNNVETTNDTFVLSSSSKFVTDFKILGGNYETSDVAGYCFNCNAPATGIEISAETNFKSPSFVGNLARGTGRLHHNVLFSTGANALRIASDFVKTPTITTTNGSPTITVSSATSIATDMTITSANVPANTTVIAVDGTTITMSANATATASGTASTFTPVSSWDVHDNTTIVPTTSYLYSFGSTPGTIRPWTNNRGSGTGAPTLTATVGEIVQHSAPAASGNIGWVCTTTGSPGTWKAYGAIAA